MSDSEPATVDVTIGETVYDEDGEVLGEVRGVDSAGFYVRTGDGVVEQTLERARDRFGRAYVMWRCWDCGEMGEIAEFPEECPACGAPKEDLYYWVED